jgi:hypothetical protein
MGSGDVVLNNKVSKSLWDYLGQHPEQVFVLKALSLVALINIFKDIFCLWWFTILLFSPVFIWQPLRISSIHQDKGMVEPFENQVIKTPEYNKNRTAGAAPCTRLTFFLSRRKESQQRKRRPWHGAFLARGFLSCQLSGFRGVTGCSSVAWGTDSFWLY